MSTAQTVLQPRILIVEDDLFARTVLEDTLRCEGYEFESVKDGREALERYSQGNFQIVITDWVMPEMNGIELCKAIRAEQTDSYTYLILLTSQDSPTNLVCGLEAGADEYIIKPVRQEELRVRLKVACRILDLELTLKQSLIEIRELSIRDSLTGVFNRRYLDHHLQQEIKRSCRYGHTLSVIMCDLDHFKKVNDTYGHQAGDEALKSCTASINASVRCGVDWMVRYGGEEFVVVLPETDQAGALISAERLRQLISETVIISGDHRFNLTISLGVVTVKSTGDSIAVSYEKVLFCADSCLYQAKNSGRNRVVSTVFTG